MSRLKIIVGLALLAALLVAATLGASSAGAAGFKITPGAFDLRFQQADGSAYLQAGGHPDVTASFKLESMPNPQDPEHGGSVPAGSNMRQAEVELPAGLAGNPTVIPACEYPSFYASPYFACSEDAQVGVADIDVNYGGQDMNVVTPIYNLDPGPGQPASFGFWVVTVPVVIYPTLRSDGDYGLTMQARNIDETLPVIRIRTTFWGVPASSAHDMERGGGSLIGNLCAGFTQPPCTSHAKPEAFMTAPMNCSAGPLPVSLSLLSWKGETDGQVTTTHDDTGPSGVTNCLGVPFDPSISATPTAGSAEASSGLEFKLEIPDDGIRNPSGVAQSSIKKAVVRLPKGMTINPASGEGLGVCTPADYARETLSSLPNEGCPNQSKLGTIDVISPLLAEPAEGSLFLAQPDDPAAAGHENPFDTLIGLYMVARIRERGIIVKVAGKVVPDPMTGQLVTTFDGIPQLPFSSFSLKFREGQRAPLSTPPACGTYDVEAELTPWSAPNLANPGPGEIAVTHSEFKVSTGVDGGACPNGGKPPFRPGLLAGTESNSAGSYSPFDVRLTRRDGEQEFTNFSIKMPPGIIGKLAGIPYCGDAAIEAAKARTATEELQRPSCSTASEVGRTLVGAGVGGIQTYVPGKVYLAGPYHGSALSIASITAAKVGPFDVGTVVIRQALKVNPETAEVFVDPTGSDPIPHIIAGIPVHARDIRVYVDRPQFILNPTSCKRTSTASTVLGSGLDFASSRDDEPITVTSPFQAADCASLGFKPKLRLQLLGGTKRGANPRLRAILTARPGDANIGSAQVTLPHSEFLDNAHIKTVCTRVQFAAGRRPGEGCPAASVYGYAKAITPLLDTPLQGPVFLRSSSHKLPDLVAAMHSAEIDINLTGRIDSVEGGRIRNTFEGVPDAPVSKFVLTMQGGRKSLLVNSTDLCRRAYRAIAAFDGQNGKAFSVNPVLKPQCRKKPDKRKHKAG
jgi:hypothetical protein